MFRARLVSCTPASQRAIVGIALLSWSPPSGAAEPIAQGPVVQDGSRSGAEAADSHLQAPDGTEPEAVTLRWWERLEVHAYADVYYAFNFNRPRTGASFTEGTGSTAKRANETGLNLAALDFEVEPEPVGLRLILNYGSAADIVHAGEPAGAGIGPDVWRFVQQASVSARVPLGQGLLVQAGIMPCHAGFESFPSKDNWNYTRSWMAELSPYYQAGVSVTYPLSDEWSTGLYVLNGWQTIGDNNEAKTLGTQVAFTADALSFSWNTLAGPELPDDNAHVRLFSDLVLLVRGTPWLDLGATFDLGHQERPFAPGASWTAGALYVRVAPRPWLAWALRGEVFRDPEAGISGAAQTLSEGTATLEARPYDNLILKLEGRYDRSTASVFTARGLTATGEPSLARDQVLVALGAVVAL